MLYQPSSIVLTNKKMEFESSTTHGFVGKKVEIVLSRKK